VFICCVAIIIMENVQDTRILYLPNALEVVISCYTKEEYLELSFDWNKPNELLPFEGETRDMVDGFIVHKNPLTIKLVKYLMCTANNKAHILSKLNNYIAMSDEELDPLTGFIPVDDYRTSLQNSKKLFKNDQHIALIDLLCALWY